MGYTTNFFGSFQLDRKLLPEHEAYLNEFSGTRRMKRNASLTENMPDPIREAVGLPIGEEGEYFVGANIGVDPTNVWDLYGQKRTDDIVDYNTSPKNQPGLWCQWVPSEDGTAIEWNESEKFYDYIEWIEYLVKHFLGPWGYKLSGIVQWRGEESDDRGVITIKDDEVRVQKGLIDQQEAPLQQEAFLIICKDTKGKARGIEKSTMQIFMDRREADKTLATSSMFSEVVRSHFNVTRCLVEVCDDSD